MGYTVYAVFSVPFLVFLSCYGATHIRSHMFQQVFLKACASKSKWLIARMGTQLCRVDTQFTVASRSWADFLNVWSWARHIESKFSFLLHDSLVLALFSTAFAHALVIWWRLRPIETICFEHIRRTCWVILICLHILLPNSSPMHNPSVLYGCCRPPGNICVTHIWGILYTRCSRCHF